MNNNQKGESGHKILFFYVHIALKNPLPAPFQEFFKLYTTALG